MEFTISDIGDMVISFCFSGEISKYVCTKCFLPSDGAIGERSGEEGAVEERETGQCRQQAARFRRHPVECATGECTVAGC